MTGDSEEAGEVGEAGEKSLDFRLEFINTIQNPKSKIQNPKSKIQNPKLNSPMPMFKNLLNLFLQSNCPICQRSTPGEICPYCTKQLQNCHLKNPSNLHW